MSTQGPGLITRMLARKFTQCDCVLVIALTLGAIFALNGMWWGRVEDWHPDQVALRKLVGPDKMLFEPPNFLKPPFHTYLNFVLAVLPIKAFEMAFERFIDLSLNFDVIRLLWSRTLTALLFLGSIALVFRITEEFFGLFAARAIAFVFATSAGFVLHTHFLTADVPVIFWMLLAFLFCQRILVHGETSDYVMAGFLTGIATATKYNGLGIGIGIVAAHCLRCRPPTIKAVFFDNKIWLGLAMVLLGFLLANPFAILSYERFASDFWYNYVTTPRYLGNSSTETSYWKFFALYEDLIGIPALVVFALGFAVSLYWSFSTRAKPGEGNGVILLLLVFLVYFYKFGSFPQLEARFVAPILPFWLMASGPFWSRLAAKRMLVLPLLTGLIVYNSISSFMVGKRFAEDPRMVAQEWVRDNVRPGSSIESSRYVPRWNLVSGINIKDVRMPRVTGRRKLFEEVFQDDLFIVEQVRRREADAPEEQWFSITRLMERRPDYIAVNSTYYARFLHENVGEFYPSVAQFFRDLLGEQYPYKIVFDQASRPSPSLLYPRAIDLIDNRMVILARK
jgi:Dolichyl-phosphate-mannose-protein mannosyltransferase